MAELNGSPVDIEALQALALVNYGHFTSIRVEAGRARGLSLHMERLVRDCRSLFDADIDPDYVRKLIRQTVASNAADAITIRVTVFDPHLDLGNPGRNAGPHFLVTRRPAALSAVLPPMKVQTAAYSRESAHVKHIGLCGTIGLRRKAQRAGYDDVLFTEPDGRISEGATWNIGFFDGENFVWPEANVLNGTTMQLIRGVHPDFVVRAVTKDSLAGIEAAFATNVSVGIRGISMIDGTTFDANHAAISALRDEYLTIESEAI
jgi:branched-subunit amino acid aminotransferase/4-amino-4-deoxychorismate lyase